MPRNFQTGCLMAPLNRILTPELIAALADAMQRGQIPGFGSAQNDTFPNWDNNDGTHPLNIRYVIPNNVQRLVGARLSFHLAAFRSYETGVASTTTGASSNASAAAQPHVHFWSSAGSGGITSNVGLTNAAALVGATLAFGKQTSTELFPATVGASVDTAVEGQSLTGHTHTIAHTHTVTPSLTYGVFEGAVAAGVTIAFDGVDKTALLGGPWSADVVEMDVSKYINAAQGAYHTIALQPTGLGRIEAHLRLSYYANGLV